MSFFFFFGVEPYTRLLKEQSDIDPFLSGVSDLVVRTDSKGVLVPDERNFQKESNLSEYVYSSD